jgi:hypothetical protein
VNINRHHIEVSGIPIEVIRKDIKNLHLGVYPPYGRVRVAAPFRLNDDALRLAIVTRLAWIRRQQAAFSRQERQSQREMVGGESHYVLGRSYRLKVRESMERPSVRIANNRTLELLIRPGMSRAMRELILNRWYRQLLRERIPELVDKWRERVGVDVADWGIKRMRTHWGTCNQEARRIWINLELAKKPSSCLEYIVVHEMVHLLERNHNDRFRQHMDRLMPQWRARRDELNRAPLAHEDWSY